MHSPWGALRVNDAHVHFFSHTFFSALAAQRGRPGADSIQAIGQLLDWRMPAADPKELAGHWLHELDRYGVSRAVIIASVPGDEDSVCTAAENTQGRLIPYAMVNPLLPDAPESVRKALGRGLFGICLFPAMHRYPLADERVEALVQILADRRAVVFVHCGVLTVGVRAKLGLPSHFDLRFSNPVDLHSLALKYPGVPFVIPHFGAGYLREALMVCDLCPNIYLDTSSSNQWIRYLPAAMSLRDVFRRAIEVAGVQRILFGTDSSYFPRGWHAAIFEAQSRIVYELGMPKEEAALIFAGNLDRLFPERN